MSLFNVTIYLETTIKGPRPRMAAGAYLVEYITSRNEPETRGKILFSEKITENALTLSLLSRSLQRCGSRCPGRWRGILWYLIPGNILTGI